uniref:Uncharacterized protein n=1 Tax=Rhizophora mucronata TaxID=61149 RepID=A0A2P2NJD9_RHIMU
MRRATRYWAKLLTTSTREATLSQYNEAPKIVEELRTRQNGPLIQPTSLEVLQPKTLLILMVCKDLG